MICLVIYILDVSLLNSNFDVEKTECYQTALAVEGDFSEQRRCLLSFVSLIVSDR